MYGMGGYLRSGCHIDTGRGLLESTSESRLDTGYIQDSQLPGIQGLDTRTKEDLFYLCILLLFQLMQTLTKVWYILKCYFPFRKFVVEKIICENLFEHYVDCKNLNWKHASHIYSWVMHINEILFLTFYN